ncbi:MAG: hypothetical protein V4857_10245 [Pseudomonadota bacterium]
MSRKNKSAKPTAKAAPISVRDSAILAADAAAALAGAHFKEATDLYKELVKRERRPEWVDGLAECYAGRANGLADKGMHRESLVLWRNRHQFCGKPLIEGPYLRWLLLAGENGEVFRLLREGAIQGHDLADLETGLAPSVLAAADKELSALPADSALLRHRPAILAALDAYGRADFGAMAEQLQAVPFRSPYRDLKPMLKALAQLHSDPAGAAEAVARLPADTPFVRMAAVLRAAVLPAPYWLAAMHKLDDDSRHMLLDVKGCPAAQRPLLLELAKQAASAAPPPTALFDLLMRHRRALPDGVAAALCRRLLPSASARLNQYISSFGKLSDAERQHVLALAGEYGGERRSVQHWRRMAGMISDGPKQKKRAALIWWHLADVDYPEMDPDARLSYLKRSVALDPQSQPVQLALVKCLRAEDDRADAGPALKAALAQFPDDVALLREAVDMALEAKAFKKACGLAKRVLELDPINTEVRALTGRALLSHARKLIKAGKREAARKELADAAEWLRTPAERASLHLLEAFARDGDAPDAHWQKVAAELGGSAAAAFRLLLEAGRTGRDAKSLLERAGLGQLDTPAPAAVLALADALMEARDDERLARAALLPLHDALWHAAGAPYAEAEQARVCDAFLSCREYNLLEKYAATGIEKWPHRPVFVYYFIVAGHGDRPEDMSEADFALLDKAAERAAAEGDLRLHRRITRLLDQVANAGFNPFDDAFDDRFDDRLGDPSFDPSDGGFVSPHMMLRAMLEMGGEKAFVKLARDMLGSGEVDALKTALGGNKKAFHTALINLMAAAAPPGIANPPPFEPARIVAPAPAKKPGASNKRPPLRAQQKDLFDE